MNITFNSLADYLKQGREIEFRYNGKDYSITNSHYKWHFCCDTDNTTIALCAFDKPDILVEKVRCIEVDGIYLAEIFDRYYKNLEIISIL